LIAPIRAAVEDVFATLKRWFGYARVRYCGMRRNESHLQLLGLVYNMQRALRSPERKEMESDAPFTPTQRDERAHRENGPPH
jgi:hypothetical protein